MAVFRPSHMRMNSRQCAACVFCMALGRRKGSHLTARHPEANLSPRVQGHTAPWQKCSIANIQSTASARFLSALCTNIPVCPVCSSRLFIKRHSTLCTRIRMLMPLVDAPCNKNRIVQLPCTGVKNSLNVAVAFGMCSYEIARQWQGRSIGNEAAE